MTSASMFPFLKLPSELRLKIYPLCHNLELPPNGRLPPLLDALISQPVLFNEALPIYEHINYSLSVKFHNEPKELAFKALRMPRLLELQHLRLCWLTVPENDDYNECFGLRSHKVLLKNNFQSLVLVFERNALYRQVHLVAEYLMKASLPGVTRVTVQLGDADRMQDIKIELKKLCGDEEQLLQEKAGGNGQKVWREQTWLW